MTPTDEAHFIALWQQGLDTRAIGQQLGIPRGTVSSRVATLVRQGKIQPRPRGELSPSAGARTAGGHTPPVRRPVQTTDTGAVQRLDQLEHDVHGLRQLIQAVIERLDHPPVQTPVQITTALSTGC